MADGLVDEAAWGWFVDDRDVIAKFDCPWAFAFAGECTDAAEVDERLTSGDGDAVALSVDADADAAACEEGRASRLSRTAALSASVAAAGWSADVGCTCAVGCTWRGGRFSRGLT